MRQALIGCWPEQLMMDGFSLMSEEVHSVRVIISGCQERWLADYVKAMALLGTGWSIARNVFMMLSHATGTVPRNEYYTQQKNRPRNQLGALLGQLTCYA